jgi:hypothetical protein
VTPAEKLARCPDSCAAFSPPDIEALIPLYHPHCEWRMGSMGAAFGTEATCPSSRAQGPQRLREPMAVILAMCRRRPWRGGRISIWTFA